MSPGPSRETKSRTSAISQGIQASATADRSLIIFAIAPLAAAGNIGSVEVSVDISHTYVGDLRISLHSPGGTEVIFQDQTGGSADNLVKTYTNATTAALGNLAGQPINGTWRLNVSDRAGQDNRKAEPMASGD